MINKSASTLNTFPHYFNNLIVKDWSTSGASIFIDTEFPSDLRDLFVELETRQGAILVYLGIRGNQILDTPNFVIPKYGRMG
ncbi:MAG TPA: hypothetical protein VLN45_13785, partial [Ignavibacteriaceae bacterium]|nr:hypothetical protein [Ignavibacteriaceae bacterium]